MIPALVMAAIAGINALKENDDKKRDHQNAINDAEQQMWEQRNAEIQAYNDQQAGIDPRANAFANNLSAFRDKAGSMPVPQDWTPLVAAIGKGAGAVYEMDQKGMFDGKNMHPTEAPELGKDVPGQNFSAAPGRAPDVNYGEWTPVQHKTEQPGGYLGHQASKWEEEEQASLPSWLRR
jgi:hypothetical protein